MSDECALHKRVTQPHLAYGQHDQTIPTNIARYQIQRLCAYGSFSRLFIAYDPVHQRQTMLKVLPSACHQDAHRVAAFARESRLLRLVSHPHIVTLYEAGEWERGPYIAMEFIHGVSLRQYLHRQPPQAVLVHLFIEIATAVSHLHAQHIVHRDLKPDNIVVTATHQAKLIDMGVAVQLPCISRCPQVVGTIDYMSPERTPTPAADIYSLGVILYELLSGKECYGKIDLHTLPMPFWRIVAQAVAIPIEARYDKVGTLIEDIQRLQQNGEF